MKKKMIIFVVVLVVLFAALYFVIQYKNNQAIEDSNNPYGKSNLDQATIEQLDDPNYKNQILPEELNEKLENGESLTVYFYDPKCIHCQRTTPILVPLTEELGIDVKKLNVLEFPDAWTTYGIEGTPTLIHFEDGEEVTRISGGQTEESLRAFFEENGLAE
ncbi:thioredoxin family protein [Virgibacillus necropolis]|uniref:Thiol reductase thioredoxin n=1 Tax=Virgibacillus necropolis TaxID=163877 RepID=A0A221MG36_9BACI|nr:thioredoxin family protein [Virgibacillus necropolis]ASN06572.1 thiol reductase thioredoxin [Virgibacillus necropolis]